MIEEGGEASRSDVIDVSKTHPNLYRAVMSFAVLNVLLGLNFLILSPTFLIYAMPNELWGSIFLLLGVAEIVFLNFRHRLLVVRKAMGFSVGYMVFLGLGTMQPYIEYKFGGSGKPASLQLPILYLFVAASQVPLLLEPFKNPWMAKAGD